jgi:tetratricopeptide (TPR) repeat protein
MKTGQVFVSHTSDMAQFPAGRSFVQAALDAVGRAGLAPVDMRYFAARDGRPAEYCRARVRSCEIYVAVVGFQYGSLVPGAAVSYTELEFEAAGRAGVPRLVFLLEAGGLPPGGADADRGMVAEFRQRLMGASLVVRSFTSADSLELEVFHALSELASNGPPAEPRTALVRLPQRRQGADPRLSAVGGRGPHEGLASVARRGDANAGCLVLPNGRLPKVRQVLDPIMLGVHPSSPVSDDIRGPAGEALLERVPVYVPRDADSELRYRVAASGFVLLVGDSSAGKSRAAYQAMTTLPDHVLIVPQDRESLPMAMNRAAAVRRCVVWLDDLEGYLGFGGLTRAGVARLLAGSRAHRVIVATLRAAEEAALTSEAAGLEGSWQHRRDTREVLELAHRIVLLRPFSSAERERAQAMAWDPRISDALGRADWYGLAEYLAAGPELLRDWEDAWSPNTDTRMPTHPRGAALIAAAVDVRRGGHTSPLPRTLLEQVHGHYLDQRGGVRLRPEPLAEAWAWATRARRATTALLSPIDDMHVQVFDYLLDTVQRRSGPGDHVPDTVMEAALAVCSPGDAHSIGHIAYDHGHYQLAERAFLAEYQVLTEKLGTEHLDTLAARADHADMLRDLDRPAESEDEHRAVVEIASRVYGPDHPQVLECRNGVAFALIRQNQPAKAEAELGAVQDTSARVLGPEHEVTIASRHLHAIALDHTGRLAEAEAEIRLVLATWTRDLGPENLDTLRSRGNLAHVLYTAGRLKEAESEARAALDIWKRVLGPEQWHTLQTWALYASVLRELGHPAESMREYQAITKIAARVYGPEHRLTLGSRNGAAFAMLKQGQPEKALRELVTIQAIASRALGPGHDVTITSRHLRAIALRALDRPDDAQAEDQAALDAWALESCPEVIKGPNTRADLADVLHEAGLLEEAERRTRVVLETRTRTLGPGHSDTARARSRLTSIEDAMKRHARN